MKIEVNEKIHIAERFSLNFQKLEAKNSSDHQNVTSSKCQRSSYELVFLLLCRNSQRGILCKQFSTYCFIADNFFLFSRANSFFNDSAPLPPPSGNLSMVRLLRLLLDINLNLNRLLGLQIFLSKKTGKQTSSLCPYTCLPL